MIGYRFPVLCTLVACNLRIDGVDKHGATVDLARQRCRNYQEISVFRQDIFCSNGQRYDYVHASQFLHHFSDKEVSSIVSHLLDMSERKLVISDLVRASMHYLSAWVFTLFAFPVFRHDARLSIRRGFRPEELGRLLQSGGLSDFCMERHFFYRFLLIVDQKEVS